MYAFCHQCLLLWFSCSEGSLFVGLQNVLVWVFSFADLFMGRDFFPETFTLCTQVVIFIHVWYCMEFITLILWYPVFAINKNKRKKYLCFCFRQRTSSYPSEGFCLFGVFICLFVVGFFVQISCC